MPRTAVTTTQLTRAGVAQPAQQNADNANGMFIAGNDGEIVLQLGSSSGTVIFTIDTPSTVDGNLVANLAIAVTAGTDKLISGLPPGVYNQSDGSVWLDCDSANGRIRCYHVR